MRPGSVMVKCTDYEAKCLGLNSGSTTQQLCHFGQVVLPPVPQFPPLQTKNGEKYYLTV